MKLTKVAQGDDPEFAFYRESWDGGHCELRYGDEIIEQGDGEIFAMHIENRYGDALNKVDNDLPKKYRSGYRSDQTAYNKR